MREITDIQLDITSVCDRACVDCCCGINMGMRPSVHHNWQYFEDAAYYLRGVDRIDLFGGEPTTHPQFSQFVPAFKDLFGCKVMSMTTDGFGVVKHAAVLHHFDFIQATPYDEKNAPAMAFLKANHPDVRFFPGIFTPRTRIGGGKPCQRAFSITVAYADGKLWPCSPGPGIPGAIGIPLTSDWRRDILEVPMPCSTCFLSE